MSDPAWLSPLLKDLRELIGEEAMLALVDARGGRRISVPAKPGEHHWLTVLLGAEAAGKLGARFGGAELVLPLGPSRGLTAMRRICDEGIAAGLPAGEIARLSGLTERTVYRRRAGREDDQLDLFGGS